jgi:anaerobic selenocysteine-containing dehydrogenase
MRLSTASPDRMLAIRASDGGQAVAFGRGTGSGTGLRPMEPWFQRLVNLFGSPNYMTNTHLCNWARDGAAYYTLGVYPVPPPDVERSGCIVLWGSNPPATLLSLGTRIAAARQRGARLVVVDPGAVGLANRADLLLQVRPGTDGALALALIGELIEHRWYDDAFVREWTNAPLLGALGHRPPAPCRGRAGARDRGRRIRRGDERGPARGLRREDRVRHSGGVARALRGDGRRPRRRPRVRCATVFAHLARIALPLDEAAAITGVPAETIRDAARLIAEHRPVGYHTWNGIMQPHQRDPGGSRHRDLLRARRRLGPRGRQRRERAAADARHHRRRATLGRGRRPPPGPCRAASRSAGRAPGNIVAYDLYDAILDARPYRVRGLVSFGGNTIMNSGDPLRGARGVRAARVLRADGGLPHADERVRRRDPARDDFLENDVLAITPEGMAQRRIPAVPPLHERRGDIEVIFALATRLGLGEAFAGGDVSRAYDEILEPAGLTWDGLRDQPNGVRVAPEPSFEKYQRETASRRPSRKVELWSERFAAAGSPRAAGVRGARGKSRQHRRTSRATSRSVMTNAKLPQYLHTQASRRRGAAGDRIPIRRSRSIPDTAAQYGITDGTVGVRRDAAGDASERRPM